MTRPVPFWDLVDKSGDCWIWRGPKYPDGYGRFSRAGKTTAAHRHAWQEANGPIPTGLFACHRCDVRACVNPAHLFIGTAADNNADMRAKGRARGPTSESRHTVKLNAGHVEIMRYLAAEGVSLKPIANAFGVSHCNVTKIIHGDTWKRAGGPRT